MFFPTLCLLKFFKHKHTFQMLQYCFQIVLNPPHLLLSCPSLHVELHDTYNVAYTQTIPTFPITTFFGPPSTHMGGTIIMI